jgi:Ala-tRNA(Pro) deacylase
MNVQEYLKEHQAAFQVIDHPQAFSAQRVAEALHVSGDWVAKSVILKAAHGFCYYLVVVPASSRVDLAKVREAMGLVDLEVATEEEVAGLCRDCEIGAMPPFGSQHGMETIVDESLSLADDIVFEANSHHRAIRMKYRDFYELEHPLVLAVATHT